MLKRITLISISVLAGLFLLRSFSSAMQNIRSSSGAAKADTTYVIIDLGTLGGTQSEAIALNESGQIVGSSTISGNVAEKAFLWNKGVLSELPTAEDHSSFAYDIDQLGTVAGEVLSGEMESELRQPGIWFSDVFTPLETFSQTQASARAVVTGQLVAGQSFASTVNEMLLWENNLLSATIPFSGGVGTVNAMNNGRDVVGVISGSQNVKGFGWQQGAFSELETLGGASSVAWDINDQAQIVGSATTTDDLETRAVTWTAGQIAALPMPGEMVSATSVARAINSQGDIVGQAEISGQLRAVLWKDEQLIDLNTLLPPETDWERLIVANDINDQGWIVGKGLIGGQEHAFFLASLPAPPQETVYLPVIVSVGQSPPVTPTPTPTPTPSPTPPPQGSYDMRRYMLGDGRLYEVQHSGGSQARHQSHLNGLQFFHTKGNEVSAEWEELWYSASDISRGTDTSPGNGQYYTLFENGVVGSSWAPRFWNVGDIYERNPFVVFFRKSDCSIVVSGMSRTWLRFEAFHPQYTFESGVTLNNVVQLAWLLNPQGQPEENYFYAEDYGLVGWGSADRGFSYISEIHADGTRPNNKREEIPCLNNSRFLSIPKSELSFAPLPLAYQLRVK